MSQAAVKIATAKPLLSVNNIEVVYDDVIQVLRWVSIEVPGGDIFTLSRSVLTVKMLKA